MSIKPLDFQVMLPKTPEVSKIHNDQNHRNIAAQQNQAAEIKNEAQNNLKHVYSKDKTKEAAIQEKQEKNQKGSDERKKKQKDKESSNNQEFGKSSKIDIRL